MSCPNLNRDTYRCVTVNDAYKPSYFQRREYCNTVHDVCPFFVGYKKMQDRRKGDVI